jgi:phosphoglycolate phosphatase
MKPKMIVFDFDGTLADSERIMVGIYDFFAAENNKPELTEQIKQKLRDGTARQAIKWAGVRLWQIPKMLNIARKEYKKRSSKVRIFAGMQSLVKELSRDFDIYILSTNSEKTVKKILIKNNFTPKVTILKGSSVFGKDKALRKLLRNKKYDRRISWMIGDEVRDIAAGNKSRLNTIGVTWGLQSEVGLRRARPGYVADKPGDILRIIRGSLK